MRSSFASSRFGPRWLSIVVVVSTFGSIWRPVDSFVVSTTTSTRSSLARPLSANKDDDKDDEAADLRRRAEELREQVRGLEKRLEESGGRSSSNNNNAEYLSTPETPNDVDVGMSLVGKRVLVLGANGRVGSMVCRRLLRDVPDVGEVVAAVHTVSENSVTSRGYGRLSYEVGAEDGRGSIGAAWAAEEDRTATFEYDPEVMGGHNLDKLRLVEVELLDPEQCAAVTEGVDAVVFCATDFNGNVPRAVSGLNLAFLFRAVASPTKGRVEVEGLRNVLEGLARDRADDRWAKRRIGGEGEEGESSSSPPPPAHMDVVLVSPTEEAFSDFETPFGTFKDIKRQGENIALEEFPSLASCVLQMSLYDDNFVDEGLDLVAEVVDQRRDDEADDADEDETTVAEKIYQRSRRRINRRDAARAIADALTEESFVGKRVTVHTALRG